MTLEKIMSHPVATVALDDTLKIVKDILDHAKFNHVLVVDDNKLLGVISDRDVFRQLTPTFGTPLETYKDQMLLHRPVHTFMTRKPRTLRKTANMFEAIDMFLQTGTSCIPIVDSENHVEGIVTKRDLLRLMKSNRSKFNEEL
jgi:acetoin utilization protein AcuB